MQKAHVCKPYRNVRGELIDPAQQGGFGCPVCWPDDGRVLRLERRTRRRRTPVQIELSEREVAHLLAAMRNWQIDSLNEDLEDAFAGHFEDHAPLDDDEIAVLCERLNFAEGQVVKGAAY
jgi:hypothetical protein